MDIKGYTIYRFVYAEGGDAFQNEYILAPSRDKANKRFKEMHGGKRIWIIEELNFEVVK